MKVTTAVIAFISIFFNTTHVFAEETIRLASGEWEPYQSQHLKYNGVASRIVSEAFAMSEVKVEYDYFPWARSLKSAKTGEWDGTFLWFDTPERRKFFFISEPILDIQYVFFHLKNYSFDWNTVDDLKGIFIGGTLEYDYGEIFQTAEKAGKISVERTPNDKLNFKKLLESRIQIFPNDLEAGLQEIHKIFTPEQASLITYHPKPIKSAPHHLLLSKKVKQNKQMMELFNKNLKRLIENGKVKQYLTESRRGNDQK